MILAVILQRFLKFSGVLKTFIEHRELSEESLRFQAARRRFMNFLFEKKKNETQLIRGKQDLLYLSFF